MTVDGLREVRSHGLLTLTFDRPEARNALTVATRLRLEEIFSAVDEDNEVEVVVITGVDPAFCAGADTKEIATLGSSLTPTDPAAAIRSVSKPVIGAINGACITGGLEIALSCDFLIASEQAVFADTHARLGVLPRWGMSALLPRAVGVRQAKELSVTGRLIDATEAQRIGLVNHVVPHDRLGQRVDELVETIRQSDSQAVAATLDLYTEGQSLSEGDAIRLEKDRGARWVVDLRGFGANGH